MTQTKPRKSGPCESDVQDAILRQFATLDWMRLWRINVGTYLSQDGGRMVHTAPKGHADLAGILPRGRALYVEVKAAAGRLSPEQTAWIAMVGHFGGLAFVARSTEDVERMLRHEGYGEWLDRK